MISTTMVLGVRTKLFALAVLVVALVAGLVGVSLEQGLRDSLELDLRAELTRHAKLTGTLVENASAATPEQIDAIADRVAASASARVTVADQDGIVLGDSALAQSELAVRGPKFTDADLTAAKAGDVGSGRARNDESDDDVLYVTVAVPGPASGPALVARVARPTVRVEQVVARGWGAVLLAGVGGLAAAGALIWLLGGQTLVAAAEAPAPPDVVAVESPLEPDERSLLSLQRMADDLESTMQTLSAERNRFEAVLQTMDQAVLATDGEQRVTTVNRAARTLLSIAEGAEGRTLVEAVRVPGLIRLADDAGDGESRQAEFDIAGGRRVEARATGLTGGGVVLVLLDVTEIRRLERVRRDFVANVSHELRTPISVIKANAETLLDGGIDDVERGPQFVGAVLRHADRLGRIVADLLDISRIEAGRYPLELARPQVSEVVHQVFESVEVEARQKEIEVTSSVPPDLHVHADRKALEHILINLVSNAVKYTSAGGHVDVAASRHQDSIRIEVRDDGPGIDPKHRARIFERFYRADPGRSRDMGGTGLGLSIVKNLVEAMDGDVGLDPRSPHGSVFWLSLQAASGASTSV